MKSGDARATASLCRWVTAGLAGWLLLTAPVPAFAQDVFVGAWAQRYSFDAPENVGLSSYALSAVEIGVALPLTRWLRAGTALRTAGAELGTPGGNGWRHNGLTDAEIFAEALLGPVRVTAISVLPTGSAPASPPAHVVAGLAAYELLPLPVRSWGTGGGWGLDAGVPFRYGGITLELSASLRSHGELEPFLDEGLAYRIGPEQRLGVRMGRQLSQLSSVEAGGYLTRSRLDTAADEHVFQAGTRVGAYALGVFPAGSTSTLLRLDVLHRAQGTTPVAESSLSASAPLTGAVGWHARTLVVGRVETRAPSRPLPLNAGVDLRWIVDGEESGGWLATVEAGTEVELRIPLPGRYFVMPSVQLRHGKVTVAEGYESGVAGWGGSMTARWEPGR